MYSRQAALLRQEFWTTFGQYMSPVVASDGIRVNWTNYKTGIRNVLFRMEAGKDTTRIAIEITHSDEIVRQFYFEQFVRLKPLLHDALQEEWKWKQSDIDENGKPMCTISKEQTGFSIFRKDDWSGIISFLKPRIIALDEFWSSAKHIFQAI